MTGPTEEWRDVPEYEGLYSVSRNGEVRNRENHILKTAEGTRGYVTAWLSKNGKLRAHRVHRLVACAFLPNPDNLPEVNHINGVKTDNRVENLEWCTVSYNRMHSSYVLGHDSGKPKRPVVCLDTREVYPSVAEAARAVSGCKQNITQCCQGKRARYKGHRWGYTEVAM